MTSVVLEALGSVTINFEKNFDKIDVKIDWHTTQKTTHQWQQECWEKC